MPPLEDIDRTQVALLWVKVRTDREGNAVVSAAPEEVSVRWVNRTRFVRGPDGNDVQVDATVAVGKDVKLGSLMFEGGANDWGTATEKVVMEVVTRNHATDLKGRVERFEYGLSFYRGALPTVETRP